MGILPFLGHFQTAMGILPLLRHFQTGMGILPIPGHFQTGTFLAPGHFQTGSFVPRSLDRGRHSTGPGSFAATSETAVWVFPTVGENVTMCLVPEICQSPFMLCYGNCCFVFFLSQLLSSTGSSIGSYGAPAVWDGEERGKILKSPQKELGAERVGSTCL